MRWLLISRLFESGERWFSLRRKPCVAMCFRRIDAPHAMRALLQSDSLGQVCSKPQIAVAVILRHGPEVVHVLALPQVMIAANRSSAPSSSS